MKSKTSSESSVAAHPDAELSESVVRNLHERLLAERARLQGLLATSREERVASGRGFADEADAAYHATTVADIVHVAEGRAQRLADVDAALAKLAEGTYGLCEETEEPIGLPRLEIAPWARYAVAHQEHLERTSSQNRRGDR